MTLGRRGLLAAVLAATATPAAAAPADPLPSWRDGPARRAILDLIRRTTRPGPGFVPPEARVASFDNDGTLWVEQPMYPEVVFALDRLPAVVAADPSLAERPVVRAALAGDLAAVFAGGAPSLFELVAVTHAGMTEDAFLPLAEAWFRTWRHPRYARPQTALIYQPMIELLRLLRREGFATWIVTGGEQGYVRAVSRSLYDVPVERVVGSDLRAEFRLVEGRAEVLRRPTIAAIDEGPGKALGIARAIGRRPVLAFGNSDGDVEMLQYATSGSGARLGLLLRHDDAAREYAYDRESRIGRLARGLDLAPGAGWVVVSMRQDWRRVFAWEPAAA